MKPRFTLTVILALFATQLYAQGLPGNDIWLLKPGTGETAVNITQRLGYDNQPWFSPDGNLIYYTYGDAQQTDIYSYDLNTGQHSNISQSSESEYSPTPIPGQNALSMIRVAEDQLQFLARLNLDNGEFDILLPDVQPVGYHTWYKPDKVALFILGDSFTLHTATSGESTSQQRADNIGRGMRTHPHTGEILFVDQNHTPWTIAALNPDTNIIRQVMPLFPNGQDFEVDTQGVFWTGNGSRLYKRAESDDRWHLVEELKSSGVNNISRLAIHPNGSLIAVVGEE